MISEKQDEVQKIFAFSEQELLDESFNPEAFISKHRKFFELEILKKDLEEFVNKCQGDIMSIMNNDYESFISLAFRLRGLKENIEKVEVPLFQNRHKYEELCTSLKEKQHIVDNLLSQYSETKKRENMLEMFIKIDKYLTLEEQLLVKINSKSIDIYTKSIYIERICRLDRIVKQYIYSIKDVYVFLDKCKERCTNVYTEIYTLITRLYIDICLTKECSQTLLNILRGYMYLNKEQEAIDLFSNTYILPLCDKYINKTLLDKGIRNSCKGLQDIYTNVLNYIQENCLGLINASKEIYFVNESNTRVYIYQFLLEGIWQYVEKYICDNLNDIFICAVPLVYHDNYMASIHFIHQLADLSPFPSLLYKYASTKHFLSQWDLSVYSQLISSDIYTPLYTILNKYKEVYTKTDSDTDIEQSRMILDGSLSGFKASLPFKLHVSQYIWYYCLLPLSSTVFIPADPLSFLYISLTVYNRYMHYVQEVLTALEGKTLSSCTLYIYLLNDMLLINKYILITPFQSPYQISEKARDSFTRIFEHDIHQYDNLIQNVTNIIYEYIFNKCNNSVSTMKTITSIYRMTQKPAPTEASAYVSRIFAPLDLVLPSLELFKNDFQYIIDNCFSYIYEHILISYKESSDELLSTISRMEDMLSKHRKRNTPISPSTPQSLTPTSDKKEYTTDEQKMRLQLKLDIQALCSYKDIHPIKTLPTIYDELMNIANSL